MFENDKFITRGIAERLPRQTALQIWLLIDSAREKTTLDYLQIFELCTVEKNGVRYQQITHSQEQPEYKYVMSFPCEEPIDDKVYCIGDETHSTMLFASEY